MSLDLLYDVPGQRLATWATTVEGALDLAPDHVSCYALTLDDPDEEGLTGPTGDHLPTTAGARRWRDRARRGQDEDRAAAAYALADAAFEGAGMPWYELSNWARPGAESRHNLAYWLRLPYERSAGSTRLRWRRPALERRPARRVARCPHPVDGGPTSSPPGGAETLDAITAEVEELILGLRTARGVGREAALARAEVFTWAAEMGLVEDAPEDRVRLTPAAASSPTSSSLAGLGEPVRDVVDTRRVRLLGFGRFH